MKDGILPIVFGKSEMPERMALSGGKFLLCGDEGYLSRSLKEIIPSGESFCPEKSRRFVEIK